MDIGLKKDGNGWAYEVQDGGRVVAQGWSAGLKREALAEARQAICQLLDLGDCERCGIDGTELKDERRVCVECRPADEFEQGIL